MKSLSLRACLALVCALSLASCGGGGGTLLLGGTVTGLTSGTMTLQNGSWTLDVTNQSSFSFTQLIASNTDFDIEVKTQPPHATCTVANGKGRTSSFSPIAIAVNCVTQSYNIGGQITGLGNATGLVLANGSDNRTISPGSTSYTMTEGDPPAQRGKVTYGSVYGITVLHQPDHLNCTVSHASGTILDTGNVVASNLVAATDISNIDVNCVAAP